MMPSAPILRTEPNRALLRRITRLVGRVRRRLWLRELIRLQRGGLVLAAATLFCGVLLRQWLGGPPLGPLILVAALGPLLALILGLRRRPSWPTASLAADRHAAAGTLLLSALSPCARNQNPAVVAVLAQARRALPIWSERIGRQTEPLGLAQLLPILLIVSAALPLLGINARDSSPNRERSLDWAILPASIDRAVQPSDAAHRLHEALQDLLKTSPAPMRSEASQSAVNRPAAPMMGGPPREALPLDLRGTNASEPPGWQEAAHQGGRLAPYASSRPPGDHDGRLAGTRQSPMGHPGHPSDGVGNEPPADEPIGSSYRELMPVASRLLPVQRKGTSNGSHRGAGKRSETIAHDVVVNDSQPGPLPSIVPIPLPTNSRKALDRPDPRRGLLAARYFAQRSSVMED